jgi:hypothetical protein
MSTFSTCTSFTRPGSPTDGDVLFETDTKNIIIWDGSNWRGYQNDGKTNWHGIGYSTLLDGTDDYVGLSSVVTSSAQQGTISVWFKTSGSGSYPLFSVSSNTSGHNGYWTTFSVSSTRGVYIGHRPNNSDYIFYQTDDTTLNDNEWHHAMVTCNGSSYKLFVDGSEDTSATTDGSNPSNVVGGWIGDMAVKNSCNIGVQRRNADGSNSYFDGLIDDVAVWDSDRSSDISSIYNSGTPGDLSSLSTTPNHWWRMGDGSENGSGTTVYDMAGSVNGTFSGAPQFSTDFA